jgi:hypothetical protein
MADPGTEKNGKNFTSETTDDCDDNARTDLNREGAPHTSATPAENVDQRSNAEPADRPPVRDES